MHLSGNHAKLYKPKPVKSKLPSLLKFGLYSLRGIERIIKPSSKLVTFRAENAFSLVLSYARLNQSLGACRVNKSLDIWYLFALQCSKFPYMQHIFLYLLFIFTLIFTYLFLFEFLETTCNFGCIFYELGC